MAKPRSMPASPNKTITLNTTPQHTSTVGEAVGHTSTINATNLFQVILAIFKIISGILLTISYCLLIFQTVYVLNSKQPKYINLRHLALKWIACLSLYHLKQGFTASTDINSQMTMILLQILIVAIAYPSRVLKAVHLKYFSHKEQQRYNQSVSDPNKYDLSFSGRICISLCILLLTFCKHLIAIVLPQHRRPIQQALRAINVVVIDRKCFWSIYNNSNQAQTSEKQKLAIKQYLVSGSSINVSTSSSLININPMSNIGQSMQMSTIMKKQSKQIIKVLGQKCSNLIANGFKPIKRVTVKYNIHTSELQILDMDFNRTQNYILQQLTQKQSTVLEFTVLAAGSRISEHIYIKFKSSRDLQNFMREIQQAEKSL